VRAILQAVSVLLLIVGVPATALAIVALTYSWIAPVQPPPSLNEGPGMAGALGWMLLVPGGLAVIVGLAMRRGLNATRAPDEIVDPEWARRHRRLL